jgi:glyceraldehyde-3-phosphate dehydrogenase/erythrose-4-phosphate dehydrogenase
MSALDRNKPSRNDQLRLIAAGALKHFPNGNLLLANHTFTTAADLATFIQADIDACDAADRARAAWLTAVHEQTASHAAVAPVLRALKRQLLAQFGDTPAANATLADFGYTAPKVVQRTSTANAAAAAKARATRQARHTMGKNQKKDVKGKVDVALVVTPTAGTAPST